MSVERIIGIDFGTSTSVIRVKRYKNGVPVEGRLSKQEVIFAEKKPPIVPTVIQRTDKGTYYGYDALAPKKGEILFQNFKVDLENLDPVQRQEARTLTEEFFAYMAKVYRSQSDGRYFGDPDDTEHTIVSYPVKWSDETKTFLIRAAEKVGFKNVEGIDEAQAAIHAVTVQREDYLTKRGFFTADVPCNILLIDMGAGTTDLVLCRHTPGDPPKNEMICTWPKAGDTLFGGREVDEILREYIRSLFPKDQADKVLKNIGIKEFKTWKETVVSPALAREETVKEFSSVDKIFDYLDIDMEPYDLDRSRFEKLAEKYLAGFPRLINGCIDSSDINKEDIDLVILTGGHSQWYFVKEMLTNRTKIDLPKIQQNPDRIISIRPQETVALGMVYRLLSVERAYIIEYYRKNMSSLIASPRNLYNHCYDVMIVKPDGTIGLIVCSGTHVTVPDSLIHGICSLDVADWRDIVSISCESDAAMGLRKDGTVVATGPMGNDVQGWRDVVSISCASYFGVGLRKDGTVAAGGIIDCENICDVQNWKSIVAILCRFNFIIGLKQDGTVVATGNNNYNQCNVEDWKDVVSISCGNHHTVGLKKDGTVVTAGHSRENQCKIQGWKDIVSISCGCKHTIGLRKDGTVVAAGINYEGQCNVEDWKDIVSISCGDLHTIGLRKDGTVVATGDNENGQCNIQNWKNIVAVCGTGSRTLGIRDDGAIIYTDFRLNYTFLEKFFSNGIHLLETKTLPWKLF